MVTGEKEGKGEHARLTLDKLSEKLSQSDKNLFAKVAEDLKKVSIKPKPEGSTDPAKEAGSSIPSISDLGSALGGWNWNSASRLLASASQVTSQVGSVIDSVIRVPTEPEIVGGNSASTSTGSNPTGDRKKESSDTKEGKATEEQQEANKRRPSGPASMSASEASSNDALVDFTLSAMESLGKKAFGVMTERDESGSLQIKGLGRPWEHLLNLKRPQQTNREEEVEKKVETTLRDDDSPASRTDYTLSDEYSLDKPITAPTSSKVSREKQDEECSGLKNRSRRSYKVDEDYD